MLLLEQEHPRRVNECSKSEHNKDLMSLEVIMPKLYKELFGYQKRLEKHYKRYAGHRIYN